MASLPVPVPVADGGGIGSGDGDVDGGDDAYGGPEGGDGGGGDIARYDVDIVPSRGHFNTRRPTGRHHSTAASRAEQLDGAHGVRTSQLARINSPLRTSASAGSLSERRRREEERFAGAFGKTSAELSAEHSIHGRYEDETRGVGKRRIEDVERREAILLAAKAGEGPPPGIALETPRAAAEPPPVPPGMGVVMGVGVGAGPGGAPSLESIASRRQSKNAGDGLAGAAADHDARIEAAAVPAPRSLEEALLPADAYEVAVAIGNASHLISPSGTLPGPEASGGSLSFWRGDQGETDRGWRADRAQADAAPAVVVPAHVPTWTAADAIASSDKRPVDRIPRIPSPRRRSASSPRGGGRSDGGAGAGGGGATPREAFLLTCDESMRVPPPAPPPPATSAAAPPLASLTAPPSLSLDLSEVTRATAARLAETQHTAPPPAPPPPRRSSSPRLKPRQPAATLSSPGGSSRRGSPRPEDARPPPLAIVL